MQAMNADTTKINIQTTQQSGAAIADDVKDTLCEGLTAAADALTQLRVPDDAMTTKESAAAIVVNADPTLAPAVHGALENAVSFNGDIAVVANALTRAADDLESSISPSSSSAAASPAGLPAGAGGHIDSIDITALLNRPTEDSFGRPIDPQSKTQAIARLDAVISALDMPIVENPDLKGLVTVSVKSTEAGSTSEKTVPIGEYVKGLKTERGKLADCVKIEAYSSPAYFTSI